MMPPVPKPVKQTASQRRLAAAERRALHYGGAHDWPALKEQVFRRDRWRCLLCRRSAHDGWPLQAAHVITVGMGGAAVRTPHAEAVSDPSNIATLCVDCHREVDQGTHRSEYRRKLIVALERSVALENERTARNNAE